MGVKESVDIYAGDSRSRDSPGKYRVSSFMAPGHRITSHPDGPDARIVNYYAQTFQYTKFTRSLHSQPQLAIATPACSRHLLQVCVILAQFNTSRETASSSRTSAKRQTDCKAQSAAFLPAAPHAGPRAWSPTQTSRLRRRAHAQDPARIAGETLAQARARRQP